jgi:hypothetical protein
MGSAWPMQAQPLRLVLSILSNPRRRQKNISIVANRVEAALPETSSTYINIKKLIKILLPRNVDYLIGYANLKDLLPEKYRGFDYAVVLARRLDDRIIDAIIDGPNIKYHIHYEEVNLELAEVAHDLADAIRLQGSKSLVIEPTIHDKDLGKNYFNALRFDFSHKMAANSGTLMLTAMNFSIHSPAEIKRANFPSIASTKKSVYAANALSYAR